MLLVANSRTRLALPKGLCSNVGELAENGVDLSLWQPRRPPGDNAQVGVVTFVFMGRLVGWKAVDLLLLAFAKARHGAPMRLWILGEGEDRPALQSLANQIGIAADDAEQAGSVHFTGWLSQPECMERLNAAECLVLPSILECGGAVVLEAMSMAKPVIATAWGGPLDYLDASCGVLVPPSSREGIVDGIAAAMIELASSPAIRRHMGDRALEKVRAEYCWEAKVDRMMAFYAGAGRSAAAGAEAKT